MITTYTETCNLIRHYDTLKYTCWTVFTAIIAGLYFAKSSNELGPGAFVSLVGVSSTYFCFLLTRVQRNYKIYCSIAEQIERVFRADEIAHRKMAFPESFRIGPFDMAQSVLPGNFDKVSRLEAIFGSVPYFMLHIIFFVGVFTAFFVIYLTATPAPREKIPMSVAGIHDTAPRSKDKLRAVISRKDSTHASDDHTPTRK